MAKVKTTSSERVSKLNREQFLSQLEKLHIHLTDEQLHQFEIYYQTLIHWNEKMNLTAITEKGEVFLKHFYDSLTIVREFPWSLAENFTVCDVGAGAGFPSIPLKIAFPHIQVSIVDSLNKRINFLEELVTTLKLTDVHLYHDRAEIFGQNPQHREKYDLVTARAVAKMSILSEFCLPLVKPGGYFIALKGASGEEELEEGKKAIMTLGGNISGVQSFILPFENSERTIIHIHKAKPTPKKYPRKPGVPTKNPL